VKPRRENYRIRLLVSFGILIGLFVFLRPYIWPPYLGGDDWIHTTRTKGITLGNAIRAYYFQMGPREGIPSITELIDDLYCEGFIEEVEEYRCDSWGHQWKGTIQPDEKFIRVWLWSCGPNKIDDHFQKDDIGVYIEIEKSSIPEPLR
jgi:hypothetical protein